MSNKSLQKIRTKLSKLKKLLSLGIIYSKLGMKILLFSHVTLTTNFS